MEKRDIPVEAQNSGEIQARITFHHGEIVTRSQLVSLTAMTPEYLDRLVQEEIVAVVTHGDIEGFEPADIDTIERCLRIHDDLGVNWAGVAVIEQLLDKIRKLEHRPNVPSGNDITDADWS